MSKADILAGALADFQAAGGVVAVGRLEPVTGQSRIVAVKLILLVPGHDIVAVKDEDGLLEFQIVAAGSK